MPPPFEKQLARCCLHGVDFLSNIHCTGTETVPTLQLILTSIPGASLQPYTANFTLPSLIIVPILTMSSPPNPTQGFRNPIIPGFNPDPSIIRVGPDYFLATSTFEFFPSIPIYHSTNLVDWKRIGHVLTRASQLNLRTVESSGGVYAPCLRYRKGRFWVTVGAQYRRSFGLAERVSTKR